MATAPLLDFASLLAPIPGANPAGARLLPDRRKKMEDARKDFAPNPTDPSAPPVAVIPDWTGLVRQCQEILTDGSKDLATAVRLTEALTKRQGFTGLRDGLELLRQLVSECWDRMHPIIEDESDLEGRVTPFEWLNNEESGAWFPATLRRVPLFRIAKMPVGLQDWADGMVGDQPLAKEGVTRAEPWNPDVRADLEACLLNLTAVEQALADKLGNNAPALSGIRKALEDSQRLLNMLAPVSAAITASAEGTAQGESSMSNFNIDLVPGDGRASRERIYGQLAQLAKALADLEPHSPIPDLLQWAVELGRMPFRQLIQELVREPGVLAEIRRQLGIKEGQEAQEGASS